MPAAPSLLLLLLMLLPAGDAADNDDSESVVPVTADDYDSRRDTVQYCSYRQTPHDITVGM